MDAAWQLVHAEGLAGLSIRELAKHAGITTPTVYAYFESKNAIYDAMFGRAAAEFADRMAEPYDDADRMAEPYDDADQRAVLVEGVRRFVAFCTSDPARYQLLFQRTIPGFEPSPESYAPAVRALDATRERLAATGVRDSRHVDMWTALITGLVDQQISNDPGGVRWIDLVDESVDMFLNHCQHQARPARQRATTTKGRPRAHKP